ncbi:MAG: hypothetical protein KDD69_02630 [Bdellovibrionales bacterium]|nr:hypothetical protein [Bdellovibrionales bacterium]
MRKFNVWTAVLIVGAALPLTVSAQEPIQSRLVRDTGCYELQYSDNRVIEVATDRYQLFFQKEPGCELCVDTILDWLDRGTDRVESELGKPVCTPFQVFLPTEIVPHEGYGGCIGVRFELEQRNCIAMKRSAVSVGLTAHEVTHQWFRSHPECAPSNWSVEEGIAEYMEFPGRYHPSRWRILKEEGPLERDEVATATKSLDESRTRATRWLQVYWLRHVHPQHYSLIEIARFNETDLPDPRSAYADLKMLEERELANERRERDSL